MMSWRKFTVQVTDAGERGEIIVNRLYPQVNVVVTATLKDGDATDAQIAAATWQWYRGSSGTTAVTGGFTDGAFTPAAADTRTIRVEATYTAKGNSRTAKKSITVSAAPTETNQDPTFPPGSRPKERG